jgi:polyhydroxybutyrate depolymerase
MSRNFLWLTYLLAGFTLPAQPLSATPITYVSETRSIVSGGVTRNYVLAYPSPLPAGESLPLVFAYHSDGGTASGFRTFIALEAEASDGAVFVYPDVPGNVFDTESYDGRTAEQDFVQDVVGAMQGEFGIARGRVFIAGFSRGAYMANILGCRLGPDVVRAVTAAEGSIYQAFDASNNPDYTFTGTGGISCPMPPSMVIWGTAATASPYSDGVAYRNLLQATQQCSANSLPGPVAPCVEYGSCKRNVVWCSIPGLADALWSGQAHATWTFFDDFLFSNDFN